MGVRMGITARGSSSCPIGRRRMLELNEPGTAGDLTECVVGVGVGVSGVPTSPMASRPYMRLRSRCAVSEFHSTWARARFVVQSAAVIGGLMGALTQTSCLTMSRTAPCRCPQHTA